MPEFLIDADAHITEPPDLWTSRVPSRYKDVAPRMFRTDAGVDTWILGDRTFGLPVGRTAVAGWDDYPETDPPTFDECPAAAYDPKARLSYLDEVGIWAQVQYPNVAGFGSQNFRALPDEQLKLICVRAYNDFLAEWCSTDPDRLLGIMAIPFWDVEASIQEIERGIELGLRGILFTGEPQRFDMPMLGSKHWDPLYRIAAEAELPLHFHIGGGDEAIGRIHDQERIREHGRIGRDVYGGCSLFLKNAIQCADLVTSGALERHPRAKFVSVESGAGWAPFLLDALDYMWHGAQKEPRVGDLSPSHLFRRQVYITYWFEPTAPRYLLDALPLDNVMFETDFPHPACLYGNVRQVIEAGLGEAPPAVRHKFLWGNAASLYGIKTPGEDSTLTA